MGDVHGRAFSLALKDTEQEKEGRNSPPSGHLPMEKVIFLLCSGIQSQAVYHRRQVDNSTSRINLLFLLSEGQPKTVKIDGIR